MSHSAHDDRWATLVRQYMVEAINELDGSRALIDEREFQPGDLWRPLLYRWLAEADAAILLLTAPALESPWVRKEATILAWRRGLRPTLPVIPVLLGIRMQDVRLKWPSIEVNEAQALISGEQTDNEAKRLASEVMMALADIGPGDDALQRWVDRVAGVLEGAPDAYLREGADELGVNEYEWRIDGRRVTVGHALLHADVIRAERSLRRIVPGLPSRVDTLVRLVAPVSSVPADVAERVLGALRRPPRSRLVAVTARFPETGPRLVDRATCCDPLVLKLEVLTVGTEHGEDAVAESFEAALRDLLKVPQGIPVRTEFVERVGPVVAFLRRSCDGGVTLRVLRASVERLRENFGDVTFVLLTGGEPTSAEELAIPEVIIAPTLNADDEINGYMVAERLLALDARR